MRYLLDSNGVIALFDSREPLTGRVRSQAGSIGLSSIVAFELYYGAFISERVWDNIVRVDEIGIALLQFDRDDARAAGEVRAKLRRLDTPIGPMDILIAGQVLARGLTLVTNNTREFARVDGLPLQDWTAA